MATEGELVKLGNGRWARFQRCAVYATEGDGERTLLAAVELDDAYQRLLEAAELSLDAYRQRGFEVDFRLESDDRGAMSLRYAPQIAT